MSTAYPHTSNGVPHEAQNPDGNDNLIDWLGWLLLANIVILAARLLALQFNATDLFFDEAQYWAWSLEPAFGYYSKPPLIAWLIGLSTSICGEGAACIRAPSSILYVIASFGVFAAAAQLYGARTAFLSGLVFASLPGVSLSAGIVSTDVPLLAAWAWALAAFIALVRGAGWGAAIALGLCLGIGLNGKYAMAYFVLCAVVYAIAKPEQRWLLTSVKFWTAIAIAAALITPNILWNIDNSFATLSHTADNAKWGGKLGNPGKALEFFGAQFGVFGPILFAGLLIICWRAWTQGLREGDALLLSFAIPVVLIVTVQAFLSRAHANWAAVSYVAAAILVTATMVRDADWGWLKTSLAIHIAIAVLLGGALSFAGQFALPGGVDPFKRTLGWTALGQQLKSRLSEINPGGQPVRAVLTDTRALGAELIYHLRKTNMKVLAWRGNRAPKDHFALTRPYAPTGIDPIVLVSERRRAAEQITPHFAQAKSIGTIRVPAGQTATRSVELILLSGYKGF